MNKETKGEIKQLVKDFKKGQEEETLKKIKEIMSKKKFSDRTITSYYSFIKNDFKKVSDNEDFLKNIRPDDEITRSVLKKNLEIKNDRKMIDISEGMLEKISLYKDSQKAIDLVIWLMLMCGRRISEITEGTFYTKKGTKKIFFKGIKKKKTGPSDEEFELHLLCNKTLFIRNYKLFKKITVGRTTLSINQSANRKIKEEFGSQFSSHSMRGIYVNYLFMFGNSEKKKINTFIRDMLKHDIVETSMNYTQYNLTFKKKIKFN